MTDTTTAPETPSDTQDAGMSSDTPAAEETAASGQPGPENTGADTGDAGSGNTDPDATSENSEADDDEHQGADGDAPSGLVKKLRKENASLRDRAKAAEATVEALQRQTAEQQIRAAGLKPAAVWAVAKLGDVLNDQGAIDTGKLGAAMTTAREQLGIQRRIPPRPGEGGSLRSGSGVPQEKPRGFVDAFRPASQRNR